MRKRTLAFILAAVMILSAIIVLPVTAAYENTHTNTGDQRYDIIEVAKTQIGNGTGSKYTFGAGNVSWCAYFVVWCARQAGIDSSIIKTTGWATADDLGVTYYGRDAARTVGINYTPQAGDLIIFDWSSNGYNYAAPASDHGDHVGIVEYVENGYVYTIEGNSGSSYVVRRVSYPLSSNDIKGYGVPNYANSSNQSPTSENRSATTVAALKAKYPQDKYWNHVGMSSNNANGYTSTPCPSHSSTSTCNAFVYNGTEIGWQCFGFALQLGYEAYGSNPKNWGRAYNLNNIKPGDIINYDGNNPGHTVFVYGVNGDIVSIAECNYGGRCRIRWDRKLNKSDFNNLYSVYVAPYALEGGEDVPEICTCSTSWAGEYTTYNVNSSLTIRSGHGTSYGVLGNIPANSIFTVSMADGSWAHITYNGISGYVSCAYIQRRTDNIIDNRYTTPFKAYCISDDKVPAYDSVSGSQVGNIYGNEDFCEIQEVYTNGWCKVNCPWPGYSNGRIVYVPLSVFIYNTSYTPHTATASYKTQAYYTAYRDSSPGYIYAGDECTVIDEYNGRYCVICPWSTSTYNGRYMVWCAGFVHEHIFGSWSNYDSTYHAKYCDCGNIDKAVHIWDSDEIITNPGCEGTGTRLYTCTTCGATKTESIAALGHNYSLSNTIPATCTEIGHITITCIRCGDSYVTSDIPALGHTFGEWTAVTPASYEADGVETRVCSVCGASESRAIPKPVAAWGDANGDDEVDILDAIHVAQYTIDESIELLPVADVNRDDAIDILDAITIAQYTIDDSIRLGPAA